MNQTILRIGFFLVGNHQYFIQNYTQILSFADQNFGSTETPVFWKRQGNRRIWFLYMIILITGHASYMYQDGYSNTYIITGDLFFFLAKNKNTEVLMHACLWDAVLEWTLSKCIFFWSTTMHCVFLPKVVIIVNIPEILKKFEICFSVNG